MPSDLQVSNIKDLTGSNTGLSIASDGQVTIAQNNPTITLGSNTTFPAGHVVQTVTEVFTGATQFTPSSLTATHLEKNITITAGNKVLIFISFPIRFYANSTAYADLLGYIYHKVTSSGTYSNIAISNSGNGRHIGYYYDESSNLPGGFYRDSVLSLSAVHTPSSGTEQYYKLYLKTQTSTNVTAGIESSGNSVDQTMILQEIQT